MKLVISRTRFPCWGWKYNSSWDELQTFSAADDKQPTQNRYMLDKSYASTTGNAVKEIVPPLSTSVHLGPSRNGKGSGRGSGDGRNGVNERSVGIGRGRRGGVGGVRGSGGDVRGGRSVRSGGVRRGGRGGRGSGRGGGVGKGEKGIGTGSGGVMKGMESVTLHGAGDVHCRIEVVGAVRRVWSTLRSATMSYSALRSATVKLAEMRDS